MDVGTQEAVIAARAEGRDNRDIGDASFVAEDVVEFVDRVSIGTDVCPAPLLVFEEERVPAEESVSFAEFGEAFSGFIARLVREVSDVELRVQLLPDSGIEIADNESIVAACGLDDVVKIVVEVGMFLVTGVKRWSVDLDHGASRFGCNVELQDGQTVVDYPNVSYAWNEMRGDDKADASGPWFFSLSEVDAGAVRPCCSERLFPFRLGDADDVVFDALCLADERAELGVRAQ